MKTIYKRFSGICPKYKMEVDGYIEYLDSSTQEGREYSKNDVKCNLKSINNCTRNECPYWMDKPEVIKG